MSNVRFTGDGEIFAVERPEDINGLYFPLASEAGLKSSVTPRMGGDAKLDQESFLLQPVSVDDLHNNRSTRNFWLIVEGEGKAQAWSATGVSARAEAARFEDDRDGSALTAGFMWQTVTRKSAALGLEAAVTCFATVRDRVEIMKVRVQNTSSHATTLTAVAAVPIYGRSADNLRDHRNVTSMLHRIALRREGVVVTPAMSFDERGHRLNHRGYYVLGVCGDGENPESFYPTVDEFIGGGSFLNPEAVARNLPGAKAGGERAGREAMGGLRFATKTLAPGEAAEYVLLMGIADSAEEIDGVLTRYGSAAAADAALAATRAYWRDQVNVSFHTGDDAWDRFMRWVCFQPFLRRLFGCSFLPHHDYGRGGRGWRDLWQDCLSLLIMHPDNVRRMIVDNFGGVRIDGTNATIIGSGQGEFIADRNGIARVWMDHALWPWMTVKLYLDQTGDDEVLFETAPYFKDAQAMRGTAMDERWREADGMRQLDEGGDVCMGTLLEHLLVEHLTGFFEVGEHNIYRLRGADWNDALDMAPNRGESVAFTCAYAGNLRELSELLERLARSGRKTLSLPAELTALVDADEALFDDVPGKRAVLNAYLESCRHSLSGERVEADVLALGERLGRMADWLTAHIRRQEWLRDGDDGWFNSYYDDHGRRVEGRFEDGVRMMLTGQVFAVMSGTATDDQIAGICRSADRYLYDGAIGGYRLNTDFHEVKLDMGRQFGFAYGEKENGSVFSHMATMYANALYRRGRVQEGAKALNALYRAAMHFDRSRIYPGIPEYFNNDGRGLYHYLTGAASWIMLTYVTEVFGVRGRNGELVVEPRLLKAQFDAKGEAAIRLQFAGRALEVVFVNNDGLDYGEYAVTAASADGVEARVENGIAVIDRAAIEGANTGAVRLRVTLGRR